MKGKIMFITKSKELAIALIENKEVETIRTLAFEEIKNKPLRNCNFEQYIMERIHNEKELEQFRNNLREIENSTFTFILNGEKVTRNDV